MPYNQTWKKCLKSLAPASLSLAMLAALAGCGGDDAKTRPPQPPQSQGVGITGLEISKGNLTPPFNPSVRNYGATLYSETPSISLTVTAADPTSALTINGEPAESGKAASVALANGANTISIVTTSEDEKNFDITTITINRTKANTRVWALDSVGGVPIENAVITLKDSNDMLLEDNISLPANKNGELLLGLNPAMKYNIYASGKSNGLTKGKDTAQALYANFDPSRESDAVMYCLPLMGGNEFQAAAPIITDISFSPSQDGPWTKLLGADNHLAWSGADLANIRITAMSRCAIFESDPYAGPPPIAVAVDSLAYRDNAVANGRTLLKGPTPRGYNGQTYYETIYGFALPDLGNTTSEREHWIDVVVYDIANNRTERRVYLTILDAAPSMLTDDDLSNSVPQIYAAEGRTNGISTFMPAINPIDGNGASFQTYFKLRLETNDFIQSDLDILKFRGYEVHRSTDGVNFERIETIHTNYTIGPLLFDAWWDVWRMYQHIEHETMDYLISEGPVYYKVRFFNGNPANGGFSQFSNVVGFNVLPPYTAELATPAHGAVSGKLYPTFKFSASNPALADPSCSDRFYFTLYLKQVTNNDPIFNVRFMVDFTRLDSEGNPWIGREQWGQWMEAIYASTDSEGRPVTLPFAWMEDDGAFVVDTDNEGFLSSPGVAGELLPGATYHWNVLGASGPYGGNFNTEISPFFAKEYPPPPGPAFHPDNVAAWVYTRSRSYGNRLGIEGAPNGFFSLTIGLNAN